MATRHAPVALDPAHLDAWASLRALAFGGPVDASGLARLRDQLRYTRAVVDDGRLLACATMLPLQVFVAGRRVPAGGLAAVASAPEARRRGMVRCLLADGLQRLHEAGVGWCLEHPFDPAYYARYGFQSVPDGRVLEIEVERLFRGAGGPATPVDAVDDPRIREIHRDFAQRHTFALARDDDARPHWARLLRPAQASQPPYVYRVQDAYVAFAMRPRHDARGDDGHELTLDARDLAYASPEGREALLRFLGSFQGQVRHVRLHLPDDDPLVLDWGAWHARRGPLLQARIADLAAALAPFRSAVERAVTVHLEDAFCAWNHGTFRLELGPDGTSVSRSGDAPQVRLDVATLTLLLAGGLGAEGALAAGRAQGEVDALRALQALSAGRRSYVPRGDHF